MTEQAVPPSQQPPAGAPVPPEQPPAGAAVPPEQPPAGAPLPPQAGDPVQPQVGAPVPPEPEKKSTGKKVLGIVAALIVAALVVGGLKFGLRSWLDRDKTAEAKVGDCIAKLPEVGAGEKKEAPEAKVVDCTSTDAAYSVVGRVENQTEESAKTNEDCRQYVKGDGDYYVYSSIKSGGTGYLLCLTPKA